MKLTWSTSSWEDYLYWQKVDKKIVKRINELLKSCMRTPFEGIGKPEALKGDLQGYWSRRITSEHRLVYKYEKEQILIAACRYHYGNVVIITESKSPQTKSNRFYKTPFIFCLLPRSRIVVFYAPRSKQHIVSLTF